MATTKPRITISLNPHVYATLKRMSELGNQPMASIVSELLESVHEPLMRTVAFLDAASEAPKEVKAGLRKSFETLERDLYGKVGHTVDQIDWLTEQLTGKKSAEGRGCAQARPGPSAPAANPPIVIRGSGSTRSGGKKPWRP